MGVLCSCTPGPYPEFFNGGGGGRFSQNWTFSSINVILYIGIYKMKCLKILF